MTRLNRKKKNIFIAHPTPVISHQPHNHQFICAKSTSKENINSSKDS